VCSIFHPSTQVFAFPPAGLSSPPFWSTHSAPIAIPPRSAPSVRDLSSSIELAFTVFSTLRAKDPTMAEEETKTPAPAAAASAPAENGEGNNGKKKFNNREDNVPVEELFDLSKPIAFVSRND
jgi:hypothetical protein